MTTLKKIKPKDLAEGRMICVPLVEMAGFAFGYVALTRQRWGALFNIFDHIAPGDTPPDDIETKPLIVEHILGGVGEFVDAPTNPEPWRLLDRHVQSAQPVDKALFQIGSKIYDMCTGQQVIDAAIDRQSLPNKEYPLDNKYSYLVTAKLLRREFRFDKEARVYALVG